MCSKWSFQKTYVTIVETRSEERLLHRTGVSNDLTDIACVLIWGFWRINVPNRIVPYSARVFLRLETWTPDHTEAISSYSARVAKLASILLLCSAVLDPLQVRYRASIEKIDTNKTSNYYCCSDLRIPIRTKQAVDTCKKFTRSIRRPAVHYDRVQYVFGPTDNDNNITISGIVYIIRDTRFRGPRRGPAAVLMFAHHNRGIEISADLTEVNVCRPRVTSSHAGAQYNNIYTHANTTLLCGCLNSRVQST